MAMFDVISIGTATRDVFLRSPLFRVLKDLEHLEKLGFPTGEAQCFALGSKIDVEDITFAAGGGANNTAVTFGRQGLKTAALLTVGDDGSADEVLANLKHERVKPMPIRHKGSRTSYSTILLSQNGERTILSYRDARQNLRKEDVPFGHLKTKWAYLAPGTMDFETVRAVVDHFANQETLVAINPSMHFIQFGLERARLVLERVKILILNREEGARLTGIPFDRERDILKKLDEIVKGIVVMTDGANGALVSDSVNLYRAGIFRERRIVDRTGAGDAFGSGFIAGLMHMKETCAHGKCGVDNIRYALRLASANGTATVECVGATCGLLTRKQFESDPRWKELSITVSAL
jgi:sugar/nucleoside kinase (ribokinase family)